MDRIKSLRNEFMDVSGFNEHVSQDYLIPDTYRPVSVNKNILGLSDSRQFESDDRWSVSKYDNYASGEMNSLADKFAIASIRSDELSSITEDYSRALMDRTRYDAPASNEDDSIGDSNSMRMAGGFDRRQSQRPHLTNRSQFSTEGSFLENVYETPIHNRVSFARSRTRPMTACGNPREMPVMPKTIKFGSRNAQLMNPSSGQYINNNPCINGRKLQRPNDPFTGSRLTVSNEPTFAWSPWQR